MPCTGKCNVWCVKIKYNLSVVVITVWSDVKCALWLPTDRASFGQTGVLSSRGSEDSKAWSRLSDSVLCYQWLPQDKSSSAFHSHTEVLLCPWGWQPCWVAWSPGPPLLLLLSPWSQISWHLYPEPDLQWYQWWQCDDNCVVLLLLTCVISSKHL